MLGTERRRFTSRSKDIKGDRMAGRIMFLRGLDLNGSGWAVEGKNNVKGTCLKGRRRAPKSTNGFFSSKEADNVSRGLLGGITGRIGRC